MADLENGLFSGYIAKNNPADPSISYQFLTAIVKGQPNQWALRGGNAASGSLSTYYSGVRPAGYNPMHKEGALLLGIGGDNSISGAGLWYEGCVYAKYNSDATEASIQSDIVAAKYSNSALTTGPAVTVGSSISFKATTPGYTDRYLAHSGATVNTQVVSSSSSTTLKQQASWTVRTGLGNSRCVSFESKDAPGSFLRHYNFVLQVNANDNSKSFKEDATFCPQSGLSGQGNSIRAWNYPTRYVRHFNNVGYVATNGGTHDFDAAGSFVNDATWVLGKSLA